MSTDDSASTPLNTVTSKKNSSRSLLMAAFLYIFASLIRISISGSLSGDLACNPNAFTIVSKGGEWSEVQTCIFANTGTPVDGAMVWIGDHNPASLQWKDYTFEASMNPTAGGGNGGIAFNIQEVDDRSVGGRYYAISIFPSNSYPQSYVIAVSIII